MSALLRSSVSDARSSLSNLINDLAQRRGASDDELRRLDFPIATTREGWKAAGGRLRGLAEDSVARIHQVQPLAQPMGTDQRHPLVLLRDLNNADKHRQGLWIAPLIGSGGGQHQFIELQWETTQERAAAMLKQPLSPDELIDFNPHPLVDGATVLRQHLPEGLDVESGVKVSALSLPLTFSLATPGAAGPYPLLDELGHARAFVDLAVWWIAGVLPEPPVPARAWLFQI